jgi:hypothetical protein
MLLYQCCCVVEILTGWLLTVIRWQHQSETIFIETRKYMQVNVENFLACSLAVGYEKIDTCAFEATLTQRGINVAGNDEHARALCVG